MQTLHLKPAAHASGEIALPGSKSISNRTLLLAALANGTTHIHDLLASDDTARMLDALKLLGIQLEQMAEHDWKVTGSAGQFPNSSAELFM
jgi:3-phosphoshikimate 1-carboxyvinyltransferase